MWPPARAIAQKAASMHQMPTNRKRRCPAVPRAIAVTRSCSSSTVTVVTQYVVDTGSAGT